MVKASRRDVAQGCELRVIPPNSSCKSQEKLVLVAMSVKLIRYSVSCGLIYSSRSYVQPVGEAFCKITILNTRYVPPGASRANKHGRSMHTVVPTRLPHATKFHCVWRLWL